MFKFIMYKIGQFIVRRLSLRQAYRFAIFWSDLHYRFSFRDRAAVLRNLRTICPDQAAGLDVQAREVFRNFGRYLVEFFRMAREIDKDFIASRVVVRGTQRIDEVLAKGKGAIFLTGHIGNWELGGVILSLMGYPSVAIALPHKERPVNDLFNKQREARGLSVIPTHNATRRCLGLLEQNKIIAVVADRAFGAQGFVLDFLGQEALFPKGPAIFSIKTGAPIIPIFLVRLDNERFLLTAEDPVFPPAVEQNGRIDDEMLKTMMRQYVAVIESKIRQYPGQWLMFRDFSEEIRTAGANA